MTDYYTDREFGPKPRVKENINRKVWDAIESLIESRIGDDSLSCAFPRDRCPADGYPFVGTDSDAIVKRVRGDGIEEVFNRSLPSTHQILEYVEFIARHIEKPIRLDSNWDNYWKHYHLQFDREEGLRDFVNEINTIFSRNCLAYELTSSGSVRRILPAPIIEMINRTPFQTGDDDLDGLLDTAVTRFLSGESEAKQDAIEKLWDAFERLKTIEPGKDKRTKAKALIRRATSNGAPVFRSIVENEFSALTHAGNALHIRHSEVGKELVGNDGEKDYVFSRMFALINFLLNAIVDQE